MRRVIVITLLLGLAVCTASASGSRDGRDYIERQEFSYPLAESGRVFLKNNVGEVRVHASNQNTVRIVAIKRAKDCDNATGAARVAELQVKIDAFPNEVRVRGEWPDHTIT